ncbi:MAG: hypothetical protein WCW87_01270 [Candidatus Paceibacterota bacterium]
MNRQKRTAIKEKFKRQLKCSPDFKQKKSPEKLGFTEVVSRMIEPGHKITHKQFRRLYRQASGWRDIDFLAQILTNSKAEVVFCDGIKISSGCLFEHTYGEDGYCKIFLPCLWRGTWKYIVFPHELSYEEIMDFVKQKIEQGKPIKLTRSEKKKLSNKVKVQNNLSLTEVLKKLKELLRLKIV